jgi:hypothetical protein
MQMSNSTLRRSSRRPTHASTTAASDVAARGTEREQERRRRSRQRAADQAAAEKAQWSADIASGRIKVLFENRRPSHRSRSGSPGSGSDSDSDSHTSRSMSPLPAPTRESATAMSSGGGGGSGGSSGGGAATVPVPVVIPPAAVSVAAAATVAAAAASGPVGPSDAKGGGGGGAGTSAASADTPVTDTPWVGPKTCSRTRLTYYTCSMTERPFVQSAVDLMAAVRRTGLGPKEMVYLHVSGLKGNDTVFPPTGGVRNFEVNRYGLMSKLCSREGVDDWMDLSADEASHCRITREDTRRCTECKSGLFHSLIASAIVLVHLKQSDGPSAVLSAPHSVERVLGAWEDNDSTPTRRFLTSSYFPAWHSFVPIRSHRPMPSIEPNDVSPSMTRVLDSMIFDEDEDENVDAALSSSSVSAPPPLSSSAMAVDS